MLSNRLDSTISNLDQIQVNLSASRGRIADTDFASETSNLARNQILAGCNSNGSTGYK